MRGEDSLKGYFQRRATRIVYTSNHCGVRGIVAGASSGHGRKRPRGRRLIENDMARGKRIRNDIRVAFPWQKGASRSET